MTCECGNKMLKTTGSPNKAFGKTFTFYECKKCGMRIKVERDADDGLAK